jgi:thiosulfate dehydrogenase
MAFEGNPMLPIRMLAGNTFGATLLLFAAQSAGAAETSLETAVAKGAQLFATATFGGNGRTCESCHQDGGKTPSQLGNQNLPSLLNAAAIYPRFSRGAGQVITLEGQVRSCIKGGLAGTPPEFGSPDLVAITSYLGSIAKGQPVEIGGAPK